jgi:hypothetical protein
MLKDYLEKQNLLCSLRKWRGYLWMAGSKCTCYESIEERDTFSRVNLKRVPMA